MIISCCFILLGPPSPPPIPHHHHHPVLPPPPPPTCIFFFHITTPSVLWLLRMRKMDTEILTATRTFQMSWSRTTLMSWPGKHIPTGRCHISVSTSWGIFIIIIIHSFYIALFSALEQTHCAHVACDSDWVTVSSFFFFFFFIARIINIHGSGVLITLFACCMAGATRNCCRLSASSVYTVQPWAGTEK